MASLMPNGKAQYFDNNGNPLAGGKVHTYAAGTTTPLATYSDQAGTVANTNPVVLNSRGEATIFWGLSPYKVKLTDGSASDVELWTQDNLYAQADSKSVSDDMAIRVPEIATYAALRAYTGTVTAYYMRGVANLFDGGHGVFRVDTSDTTSADNSVTILVDAIGRRWKREFSGAVDARWSGAKGNGVTNDTAAIQAAIAASVAASTVLFVPGGTYLVTDTLSIPNKTQIVGEHRHQYAATSGTTINFQPTTAKSLFVPDGAPSAFRWGFALENLYISGNSANASGNSIYAIDAHGWNKSVVRNVAITNFRTGVRCYATINNRFEFLQIQSCYVQNILYDGGFSTTDVWEQCYIGTAPIGVQTNGANLAIRFNSCLFESITTYGINIVKECYGFLFLNCYGEDTPNANVATNALFRVGYDGAVLAEAPQLIIAGGHYGGRNAGGVGSFIDVDYTDGVQLGGMFISRFTNVVKTSANTQTHQIVATGWTSATVGTQVTDTTKVDGFYPLGAFNSSTRNQQTSYLEGEKYIAANTACTGAITTAVSWNATKHGNVVTLRLPSTVGIASAATNIQYGVTLPVNMRPSETQVFPCAIKDADANLTTPGMVLVLNTGEIRIYKDMTGAANFTAGANAGIGQSAGVSVSWTV